MNSVCLPHESEIHKPKKSLNSLIINTLTMENREILSIETAFINSDAFKIAVNIRDINAAKRSKNSYATKKFTASIHLSNLIANATEWFNSEAGKEALLDAGISWTKNEFGQIALGMEKRQYNRCLQVAKLDERIIAAFNVACDRLIAASEKADRSLIGLLKFAKDIDLSNEALGIDDEASEDEIIEAENEAIESAEIGERTNYILTLSFKNTNGKNLSLRIDDDGNLTGSNLEEISAAVSLIANTINQ